MTEEKNKISKKKIDAEMGQALFSDTERFEMWFAENWKKTAAVSLIIVIAISAAFGITGYIADRKAAGGNGHCQHDPCLYAEGLL